MQHQRVVVTGMGALTPIGNTLPEYRTNLFAGANGCAPITRFDPSKLRTQFACEVKGFDPLQFLDKKELKKHDLFSQYAMACSQEAVLDSGLLEYEPLNKNRVGVIWTSGIGGILSFQEEMLQYFKNDMNPRYISPFFVPRMLLDLAAGNISIKYGFKGLNFSVVSACATSANALIDAMNYIRLGKADAVVVGGSEAPMSEFGIGSFNALKALSERNEKPETASRPYDLERDGFVMGEGAGCMILESMEHAQRRGATIYAEVAGAGLTADAYHITAPDPTGDGVMRVMREALEDAAVSTSQVDYINTHGTSTPLGDIAEVKAIQEVFGEQAYALNMSSTKSMIGHLMGAAGVVEAIAAVLAIRENKVPPTINHFTDDPSIDPKLNFTFHRSRERKVDIAMSNNFGFGGHNASIVFRRYPS
jgi:3-oxoacyl-[acyl-carrier-protein] synthase II